MTTAFEQVRRLRQEVSAPDEHAWVSARAALDRAISAERVRQIPLPEARRARPIKAKGARRHRARPRSAWLALAAVPLAAVGIAAAAGVLPDLSSPDPNGPAGTAPALMRSSFARLGRPQQSSDLLPQAGVDAMQAKGGFGGHYGVNPRLARLAGTVEGTQVWLVPGRTGSCIYGPGGGAACGPNGSIATEGLFLALVPVGGGAASILGVAPDQAQVTAVDTDGSAGRVHRAGNAFSITGDRLLRSFTVRDRSGQSFTTSAPAGAHPGGP